MSSTHEHFGRFVQSYPFEAVACMKDYRRQKDIEENLWVKGNLVKRENLILENQDNFQYNWLRHWLMISMRV